MRHPRLPEIVKCIFLFVVIGLGCSALYGSGGVSELLEAVFVPDATAIPVSNRTGARCSQHAQTLRRVRSCIS